MSDQAELHHDGKNEDINMQPLYNLTAGLVDMSNTSESVIKFFYPPFYNAHLDHSTVCVHRFRSMLTQQRSSVLLLFAIATIHV